ncbi:MAG: hypothetical protein WBY88_05660 [Desulfosarcina sp.]
MLKTVRENSPAETCSGLSFGRWVLVTWLMCSVLLFGCAVVPEPTRSTHVGSPGPVGGCADFFASLDARTARSNAFDSGYERVEEYPYIRTDRFIASFREEAESERTFDAWVDRMQAVDRLARRNEIAQLSDADILSIGSAGSRDQLYLKVVVCGDLLRHEDLSSARKRNRLREIAVAHDEYITPRRVVGLYPLAKVFVSHGVDKWHAEERRQFSLEPNEEGQSVRYVPVAGFEAGSAYPIVRSAERDALGIPIYAFQDRRILFHTFAPVWKIQHQSGDDLIGSPTWTDDARIGVDTGLPQTYTHLSFTRFEGAVLTQLNYIIWFPARTKDRPCDIYAGLLDGITFRVTLDLQGEPILYESMHNCGCYYKAYPTRHLKIRETIAYAEPPLILEAPEIDFASQSLTIAMEAGTHYIRHLYPLSHSGQAGSIVYAFADYDELKRLAHPIEHSKSMFDRYGLVPGSQRMERSILWPTGVLSPGAMRQWGTHAVAFVGRRHFDDPFYMDNMFTRP